MEDLAEKSYIITIAYRPMVRRKRLRKKLSRDFFAMTRMKLKDLARMKVDGTPVQGFDHRGVYGSVGL